MKKMWRVLVQSAVVATALGVTAVAQQPQPTQAPAPGPPPAPAPRATIVPLKVDVVLVKHRDGKVISRTPYALSVNTDTGKSSIRMGAEIPVPVAAGIPRTSPDGQPIPQGFQYKDVGTNIDCYARTLDGRRYQIGVTIEDTSVYPTAEDTPAAVAGAPTLRTFRASNDLVLTDGQTIEFLAATDKVSGEVITAEVKLTVLK